MDLFGPIAANDNDRRICPVCDEPVIGKSNKVFCSRRCKRRVSDIRNAERRRASTIVQEARRAAKQPVRQCEWCGDDFQALNKGNEPRFCSKSCSLQNTNRETYIKGVLSGVNKLPSISFSVYRPLCDCCGIRFDAPNATSRLCSEECRKIDARKKARERSVANDNVDRAPRPCAECGTMFSTSYGDMRTVYCSKECGRRNARRTKRKKERARLRGAVAEMVNPITVLERDGWRCQICGIDTPRELRGTYEPNAPEMDHIKPLAKGGSHTYDNVQCACRQCNAAKSDALPIAA